MSDRQFFASHAHDAPEPLLARGGTPGKSSLTSRLAPRTVLRAVEPRPTGARDPDGVADDAAPALARAAGSTGAPLPGDVRDRFEASLGADLSSVRVHTGADSAAASAAVGARAYAVGDDIHFAEGQYRPDDPFGLHLLAHEVAHTVQQAGGGPSRQHKLAVSAPGDHAELEADRAADAMVRGDACAVGGAARSIARAESRGAQAARGHAATTDDKKQSAALTKTSVAFSQGGVTGTIDWSKGVTGSVAYKVEQDAVKLPQLVKQFPIVSFKKVVGLLGEVRSDASLKYGGALAVSGNFEEGKGGTISLVATGSIEASLSGSAKIAAYVGMPDEANLNAGLVGKIEAKAVGAVTSTQPLLQLGPDGTPSGAATIEGDVTIEQNATWAAELGWYADKKAGSLTTMELGREPLGKLHNVGFKLTIGADGSVTPTWKWPPTWEPPTLTINAGREIQKAKKGVADTVERARTEVETQRARDALAPEPEMSTDDGAPEGGMSEDPSISGGTSG